MIASAINESVHALRRMGKIDEATQLAARLPSEWSVGVVASLLQAQAAAGEGFEDDLLDGAKPGLEKISAVGNLLRQQYERQQRVIFSL